MKLLITGGTGFLGSRLVEHFAARGNIEEIWGTGRKFSEDNRIENDKVNYLLGDLTDRAYVEQLFKNSYDVIINCASKSSPWGSRLDFFQANVASQKNIIDINKSTAKASIIYISSPSIYFKSEDQFAINEESSIPEKFVNDYAKTKYQAERLLRFAEVPYIILRPRALIGRGDTVIMPRLIRAHKAGRLKIVGNGKNQVDLTSVSNMCLAVQKAIEAEASAWNEDYNITNGEPVLLWEAINMVLEKIGRKKVKSRASYPMVSIVASFLEWKARVFHPSKEPSITRYSAGILAHSFTLDITKAKNLLNYEPIETTEEAIQEFAEWYLSRSND